MNNINTKSYWNQRFSSGNWEQNNGRYQTIKFALEQIPHLNIPKDFSGTILDFGCGLGDAFPIYNSSFPKAKLIGLDISEEAIYKCNEKYGHLAKFIAGDYNLVPKVDVIIASNVFEHLSDDIFIAKNLLVKCKQLYIIVPYKEKIYPGSEHVNSYDINYFNIIGNYSYRVYESEGFSRSGIDLV